MITRVGNQETQELAPDSEVYDRVDMGKGERILWTCLVQAHVIKTNPPFPFFFGTRTRLAIQSGCWISLTNPAARSLDNSSPMARCFSLLKHRRPCLTGFELGLMLRVCSVTFREMVDISAELHTNMSLLHRRKSTSLLWGLSRSQFEQPWQGRRRRSAQPWHPQHP
jgi:hypothetical protein